MLSNSSREGSLLPFLSRDAIAKSHPTLAPNSSLVMCVPVMPQSSHDLAPLTTYATLRTGRFRRGLRGEDQVVDVSHGSGERRESSRVAQQLDCEAVRPEEKQNSPIPPAPDAREKPRNEGPDRAAERFSEIHSGSL